MQVGLAATEPRDSLPQSIVRQFPSSECSDTPWPFTYFTTHSDQELQGLENHEF